MKANDNISIAAVIVTYNRKHLLLESIMALLNQEVKFNKIIIIDNASTDNTEEYIRQNGIMDNNEIFYKKLPYNIGGSGGFYEGIKYCLDNKFEWVVLLDDDAILKKDFLYNILKAINMYPNIMVFSGTVMTNGVIDTNHRRRIINTITYKQKNVCIDEYKNDIFYCDIISFVGVVIKTDLINTVGLPERNYFIWYDDTEYSIRLRKLSQIINVNNAIIYHKTDLLNNNYYKPNWKEYYGIRNKILMQKKHSTNKFMLYIYLFIKLVLNLVSNFINKKFKNYRRYRFKLILKSYKDALFFDKI